MKRTWGGAVIRTSAAALVAEGLPPADPPSETLTQALRGMQRDGTRVELAARSGALLQEPEVEELLGQVAGVGELLTRTRLRLACEAADRGLHLAGGFMLNDWLARQCPDLDRRVVIDLGRLAQASREPVHAPLVEAVAEGAMSVARAARLHRALVRIRGGITDEHYAAAVEMLTGAGSDL